MIRCHFERRRTWLTLAAQVGLACQSTYTDPGEIDVVEAVLRIAKIMREERQHPAQAAAMEMALDLNPRARLALAAAWDLLLERKAA